MQAIILYHILQAKIFYNMMGRKFTLVIKLYLLNALILFFIQPNNLFSQNINKQIKLNQLGFYPNAPKVAVVTGTVTATSFYIVTINLKDTVFIGKLGNENNQPILLQKPK